MIPYRLQLVLASLRKTCSSARGMAHWDNHDTSGTVLLAGSGRSGTTWLGQIINHDQQYREIFEPFHPEHVRRVQGWPVMRYLPADARQDAAGTAVSAILAGKVRTAWTDRYNTRSLARRRMIKAIRANLLLGWISRQCPQVTMLYAMRHPCAVVHSRVKLGWDTHLDQLLAQPRLMQNHLAPYSSIIERTEREGDAWERHTAMWCIENMVPLRELLLGDMHVLFYEQFCTQFDEEVAALFDYLGTPVPQGIERARRQRSAHFRRDSAILRGGDLISDWQRHVTPRQIDRTLALLHTFGLSHLYGEGPLPLCPRDQVFIDSHPIFRNPPLRKDAA